jgi:hypothetical protein
MKVINLTSDPDPHPDPLVTITGPDADLDPSLISYPDPYLDLLLRGTDPDPPSDHSTLSRFWNTASYQRKIIFFLRFSAIIHCWY